MVPASQKLFNQRWHQRCDFLSPKYPIPVYTSWLFWIILAPMLCFYIFGSTVACNVFVCGIHRTLCIASFAEPLCVAGLRKSIIRFCKWMKQSTYESLKNQKVESTLHWVDSISSIPLYLYSFPLPEVGNETMDVPQNLTLSPYTHWAVYTKSNLVEQSTPVSLQIYVPRLELRLAAEKTCWFVLR